MRTEDLHISDTELLRMVDGELSARRTAQVRSHLEACWSCRARRSEIELSIMDFALAYGKSVDTDLPPVAGRRAILLAHLSQLPSTSGIRSRQWFNSLPAVHVMTVCMALFVATLTGGLILQHVRMRSKADEAATERGPLPNRRLTPGATRTATIQDLCSEAHEEVVGQVTASLRNKVLGEYGIAKTHASDYEIDYLIAPGLGGAEDIQNLWPQPYSARVWNSYAKDALEERLHQLVCERKLDLVVAQRDIAGDWIGAYKKYIAIDGIQPSNLDSLNRPILHTGSEIP